MIGLNSSRPAPRTYRVEFSLPDGEVTADLDEAELSVVWEASRPYLPPGYTEEELEAEWAEEEALRRALSGTAGLFEQVVVRQRKPGATAQALSFSLYKLS